MEKVIITAAICGAEVRKEHNPNVPYTVDEIANEAKRAFNEGASLIHLHVREDDGTPTQRGDRFRECIDAIENLCPGVIIQPSTGGAAGMSAEERLQPVELKPETASLDCGTLNFGGDIIFINTENMIKKFALEMDKRGVKPELEVFDRSMINTALSLLKDGFIKGSPHFNLVMGVNGGIGGSLQEFSFLADSLPGNATFTATGIGRYQFQTAAMAAISGGHIRVGFEDNIYISSKRLAESNGELVEKAVKIARQLEREIASPQDTRRILNLKRRCANDERRL